jgi:hypothetical protein
MTRFTDRVTRDLHQIADRSTPSSTAWDSIRTRIESQTNQPTMEVIMLSPDRNDSPKRGWMLAAAAVAGLALVGGLVFATTRSDDDTVPADTPTATLPAEPAPDAEVDPEVDPDAEAVVVPAPEPTTAAEVEAPVVTTEPGTVAGTFSTEDVVSTTSPSSSGLIGDEAWQATTVYEGSMAGTAPGTWQTWDMTLVNGQELRFGEFVFTGTIEGLGSGTLTYSDEWVIVESSDFVSATATITGGTGDFEGAYGSAVLKPEPAAPGDSTAGTYSWNITVPPKGSLMTVTATGTATTVEQTIAPGSSAFSETQNFEGSLVGSATGRGLARGYGDFWSASFEFSGTIDGLGSGTMTFEKVGDWEAESLHWFDVVTGGTGDFEGITGTGQDGPNGSYIFVLTAPVNQ